MTRFGDGGEKDYLLPGKPTPKCASWKHHVILCLLFTTTLSFLFLGFRHFNHGFDTSIAAEVEAVWSKETSVGKDIIPKLLEKQKCKAYRYEESCDNTTNCIWNQNIGSCKLCRMLTRKKSQYDEADACGMDDFLLRCDMNATNSRIFVRQVKQDVYRDLNKTEREKDWKSKVRARSVTTYCAQNMDQEKSLCRVDRDVFVTPGTNDRAIFTIKYVCIYEAEMIGNPKVWPMDAVATRRAEKKKRTKEEEKARKKKIDERRKIAREKAAKKVEMEEACKSKKTEEECSTGCFWNKNLPSGRRCKLCRGLSRKNPQYDEADVCLNDHFTLSCDDRGIKARIFVREVLQDSYAGAMEEAKKDYQSKYRARRITMFCAIGKNFDNNRCRFRRYQFAGGDISQGVVFTIKYACFYANSLPKIPRIYINLNDTTPQELSLMKRLEAEQAEEDAYQEQIHKEKVAKEEAKKELEQEASEKKKAKKPPKSWWDAFTDWTENLFKSKKQKRRDAEAKQRKLEERMHIIMGTNDSSAFNITTNIIDHITNGTLNLTSWAISNHIPPSMFGNTTQLVMTNNGSWNSGNINDSMTNRSSTIIPVNQTELVNNSATSVTYQ